MNRYKILAAKIVLVLLSVFASPSHAGIPVIDGTNLSQNVMTAVEEVAQTIKQVQQYATQLNQYQTQIQQYQNMLQNTLQPAANIYRNANQTINGVLNTINTLRNLQNQYGNLANYLNKFKSLGGYANNPCFTGRGCTAAQWADLLASRNISSTSQQDAFGASLLGLQRQQQELQTDANTLMQLQGAAQGAQGHLQALGYANQLASAQSNQLLQIRALLIAQQNALTARMQAEANREAQQEAASRAIRAGALANSRQIAW